MMLFSVTLNYTSYYKPPNFRHFCRLLYLREWIHIETSNLVDRLIVTGAGSRMANRPGKGRGQSGHVNQLNFGRHQSYLWNG